MLEAYLDESGIHQGSEACAVAGFVGSVRTWVQFNAKWNSLMDENGVESFRAKDFYGGQGDFKGWEADQRDRFIESIVRIVQPLKLHWVGGLVDVQDFLALSVPERRYMAGATLRVGANLDSAGAEPYFLPFTLALIQSVEYADPGIKVNVICEEQAQFEGWARRVYKDMKVDKPYSDHLETLTFAPKNSFAGLGLADLAVHSVYREHLNRADRRCWYFLHSLARKDGKNIRTFTGLALRHAVSIVPERIRREVLGVD